MPTVAMVAKAACNYVNEIVKKGSSQLDNNWMSDNQKKSLSKGIKDIRFLSKNHARGYCSIETNDELIEFNSKIEIAKKYSLGNCHEMALLALEYITNNSSFFAEIFVIQGGDHVFVVINRDIKSDPNKPLSWGKNSYFCDPWSNKIYPCSQFYHLRNFYCINIDGTVVHATEILDPAHHTLHPIMNNIELRNAQSPKHLQEITDNFIKKTNLLLTAANNLNGRLQQIKEYLIIKKNNPIHNTESYDKKVDEINKLITCTRNTIVGIENNRNISKVKYKDIDYVSYLFQLEKRFNSSIMQYNKLTNLNEDLIATLNKHDEKSNGYKIKTLFNIPSNSQKLTIQAFNDTANELQDSLKTLNILNKLNSI